jgi:hypothetical protein
MIVQTALSPSTEEYARIALLLDLSLVSDDRPLLQIDHISKLTLPSSTSSSSFSIPTSSSTSPSSSASPSLILDVFYYPYQKSSVDDVAKYGFTGLHDPLRIHSNLRFGRFFKTSMKTVPGTLKILVCRVHLELPVPKPLDFIHESTSAMLPPGSNSLIWRAQPSSYSSSSQRSMFDEVFAVFDARYAVPTHLVQFFFPKVASPPRSLQPPQKKISAYQKLMAAPAVSKGRNSNGNHPNGNNQQAKASEKKIVQQLDETASFAAAEIEALRFTLEESLSSMERQLADEQRSIEARAEGLRSQIARMLRQFLLYHQQCAQSRVLAETSLAELQRWSGLLSYKASAANVQRAHEHGLSSLKSVLAAVDGVRQQVNERLSDPRMLQMPVFAFPEAREEQSDRLVALERVVAEKDFLIAGLLERIQHLERQLSVHSGQNGQNGPYGAGAFGDDAAAIVDSLALSDLTEDHSHAHLNANVHRGQSRAGSRSHRS